MALMTLKVNGKDQSVDVDPGTPLLWVLRDGLGLLGTKYGCGEGACGACTVHVDGEPRRSCTLPVSQAVGHQITTIEGLEQNGLHPVQKVWIQINVPQCGYCQPGQIMQAVAFLNSTKNPTDQQIDETMGGNLCRCGTYQRIRAAIKAAYRQG